VTAPAGVVWVMGRPSAGKSALAQQLVDALRARGLPAVRLDSDEARAALTPHPDYSPRERELVYRALAWGAETVSRAGVVAVVAATAHRRAQRGWAREIASRVAFVYARCPLELCQARDPKGLYAAAARDPGNRLPGVGEPFEEPEDADVIDTDRPVAPAALSALLERLGYLVTPPSPSPTGQVRAE
jgi:adenylylsulfate kinase